MNCKEFENIVNELAHGRIMPGPGQVMPGQVLEDAARACGLAHAQVCARCARRLGEERVMSDLLRALAASDEEKSAPSATESVLVAAFRQNAASGRIVSRQKMYGRSSNLPTASQATRSENSQQVGQPAVHRRWVLAAAAMILFAFGAFGLTTRLARQIPPTTQELIVSAPGKARGDMTVDGEKNTAGQETRPAVVRPQGIRYRKASLQAAARPRTKQVLIRDEITLYADDADVVTDFIPLTYGDSIQPIEGGELIRVRMPRTALLKFGLPMNVERAADPVKADLLVGDDGLAHAIRFVR